MDLLLSLLVFLFAAKTGEAIKCYECNSRDSPSCADEFHLDEFKKDCSMKPDGSKYTLCRKIFQQIDIEMNSLKPNIRIIRQCGWVNATAELTKTKCYYRTATFGGEITVCACSNSDYCNSAGAFAATLFVLASVIWVPFILQ